MLESSYILKIATGEGKFHSFLKSIGQHMKRQGYITIRNILWLAFIIICIIDSLLFAQNDKNISTIQAQLNKLKVESKQRLFVKFRDEIDPSIVRKYGRYKKSLTIINSALAEIDVDKIKQNFNEVKTDVQRIRSGIGGLLGGGDKSSIGLLSFAPLIEILISSLRKSKQ